MQTAYGMDLDEDPLTFLLALNGRLADLEAEGQAIMGPGLPLTLEDPRPFITADRVMADGYVTV